MKKFKSQIIAFFLLASSLFIIQSESLVTLAAEEISTVYENDIIVDKDTIESELITNDTPMMFSVAPRNTGTLIFTDDEGTEYYLEDATTVIDLSISSDGSVALYFYADGTGLLHGTGTMRSFGYGSPFYEIADTFTRFYITESSNIVTGKNLAHLFDDCANLETIIFNNCLNTSKVTNMSYMFYECTSLTSLDLFSLNTSNVTNMHCMFFNCENLTSLDLSNFNTEKVTDIGCMFCDCSSLTLLDLSSFNTSNVTNMYGMFSSCKSLTSLDLSSFNTSNVTDMHSMFGNCRELTELNLSNFDTHNVTKMNNMFWYCSSLTSLDLSNFDTHNVTDMHQMFEYSMYLTSLDLSNFDTSNVTDMRWMFSACSALEEIKAPKTVTTAISLPKTMYTTDDMTSHEQIELATDNSRTYMTNKLIYTDSDTGTEYYLFDASAVYDISANEDKSVVLYYYDDGMGIMYGNGTLKNTKALVYPNYDSLVNEIQSTLKKIVINEDSNIIANNSLKYCFYNYSSLIKADLTGLNTENVTDMSSMFSGCSSLTSLDVSGFDTRNVTKMNYMFDSCSSLTSLDVSGFNTGNVTDMSGIFEDCNNLTSLDVSGFNTGNTRYMVSMFFNCNKLTSLDVSGFNTEKVIEMNAMFYDCKSLTSLDVSRFNTESVTDMTAMFDGCSNLTSLDVSGFNTEKIIGMSGMFSGCNSLTSLDVSGFNTENVTSMSSMFYNCRNLTSLDVSRFNTENVESMSSMFYNCSGLTSLDVSGFKTENVTNMNGMFYLCSGLTSLNLSGFNTENVTDMYGMFYLCSGLTSLDVSGFNTENVTSMSWMFGGCSGLTSLKAPKIVTSEIELPYPMYNEDGLLCNNIQITTESIIYTKNRPGVIWTDPETNTEYFKSDATQVIDLSKNSDLSVALYYYEDGTGLLHGSGTMKSTGDKRESPFEEITDTFARFYVTETSNIIAGESLSYLFYKCVNLETIIFNNCFDTSNTTDMSGMFYYCNLLTYLDLSNFDTSNITKMCSMFNDCKSLTLLNLSNFDTNNATDMNYMFNACNSLTSLNLSNFDTSNVTNMCSMFNGCKSLTSLDLSSFDTSSVTNIGSMFYGCSSLTSLNLLNFDTSNVKNMSSMFNNCSSLTSLTLSNFDTSNATNMGSMFYYCVSLTSLDLSSFNTSNVTNMNWMFNYCYSLTYLDLSNFNTSNVTGMNSMFYNCSKLETLNISSFDTSNVTNMGSMFSSCKTLTSLNLSHFDTSSVTNMSYMFYYCNKLTSLDLSNFDMSNVEDTTNMFESCNLLHRLETPNTNSNPAIELPIIMYELIDNNISAEELTYIPITTGVSKTLVIEFSKHINEEKIIKEPSCAEFGIKQTVCNVCDIVTGQFDIDKTPHACSSYTTNNDATCSVDGTKSGLCDYGCGTIITVEDIGSKIPHKFTNYISNNDATCQDGTKTASCDYGCGTKDTITDIGSATGHNYSTKKNTYTDTTKTNFTVTNSGNTISIVNTNQSSKGSTATYTMTITAGIPMIIPISYVVTGADITLGTDGQTTIKYDSTTLKSFSGNSSGTVNASVTEGTHTITVTYKTQSPWFGSVSNSKITASITSPAIEKDVCETCGNMIDHKYNITVTDATCTEDGYTTKECEYCHGNSTYDEVEAKGHTPAEPVKENIIGYAYDVQESYDEVIYCDTCHIELQRTHIKVPLATVDDTDYFIEDCQSKEHYENGLDYYIFDNLCIVKGIQTVELGVEDMDIQHANVYKWYIDYTPISGLIILPMVNYNTKYIQFSEDFNITDFDIIHLTYPMAIETLDISSFDLSNTSDFRLVPFSPINLIAPKVVPKEFSFGMFTMIDENGVECSGLQPANRSITYTIQDKVLWNNPITSDNYNTKDSKMRFQGMYIYEDNTWICNSELNFLDSFRQEPISSILSEFDCDKLKNLVVLNDPSVSADLTNLFLEQDELEVVDIKNTECQITNFNSTFKGCTDLKYVDLSSLTTSDDVDTTDMFTDCTSLQMIKTPKVLNGEIQLPITMYDKDNNEYTVIPANTESKTYYSVKQIVSNYSITIPIGMEQTNKKSFDYNIVVNGTLDSDMELSIIPEEYFTMSQTNKNDITAHVVQENTICSAEEINDDNNHSLSGCVIVEDLSAGEWTGFFVFTIMEKLATQ